ncbi:hypothetical protein DRN73_10135 [Candidatus Pacearchaeota archaeon]|nr:MAG: hypothetical protein DRN73_10135 [Candidatus Pacearchaeota archaeon]
MSNIIQLPVPVRSKKAKIETKRVRVVPCEIYSRVVGYFRPVSNWNIGKQQEFKERKTIKLSTLLEITKSTR